MRETRERVTEEEVKSKEEEPAAYSESERCWLTTL